MDKNILKDENLNSLGYIKEIDLFSMVDKEFDKKRERQRAKRIVGISSLIIAFIAFTLCLIVILLIISMPNVNILKVLIGYYFISVSTMMLLIVPIKKKKKLN